MIDIRTIGTSGGSIASIDNRGRVARWSSQSRPGSDKVAEPMRRAMDAVVHDSFLISTVFRGARHPIITEMRERLPPALQHRGLTHTAYTGTTLREVLCEF